MVGGAKGRHRGAQLCLQVSVCEDTYRFSKALADSLNVTECSLYKV